MDRLFEIVFEDDDLLVINKPADLVCHPTKGDVYSSLISRVRLHLGAAAEPHMINRLDRETSGLVLVAKSREVAASIGRIWENRQVIKEYLAIVRGRPSEDHFVVSAALGRDNSSILAIKDCVRHDGASAETEAWVLKRFFRDRQGFGLLRIIPKTGRKHQIRIHLSHLGHPLVGDKIYGGDEDLYLAMVEHRLTQEQRAKLMLPTHALHAQAVRFDWQGASRAFWAPPGKWFVDFCGGLD